MGDSSSLKREIRKRLFRAAARVGDATVLYGLRWCRRCRGVGDVCVERSDGAKHRAAFEMCSECAGEGIVTDGDPPQP